MGVKNDYLDDKHKILRGKVTKIDGSKVYFKTNGSEEENYCDTSIEELPKINSEYDLYIHKTMFGWWLNGYEEVKDTSKLLNNIEYKSNGELQIAMFLTDMKINFRYEKKFLIEDTNGMDRIVYPDFWLLEYGIMIEFWGMEGNKSYDDTMELKKNAYFKERLELISIVREEINSGKFKKKIIKEVKQIITKKNKKIDDCLQLYIDKDE